MSRATNAVADFIYDNLHGAAGEEEMTTELAALESRIAHLEAELRALRDAEEIERFHCRYVRALADRDFDSLLDYFDDEAVIDMRTHGVKRGKEEIAEHHAPLREVIAEGSGYVLSSPVISVDGDLATGEWTWHRLLRSEGWLEGRYRCEYVRRDGRWKFASMWFRVVLPDPDPA
jgi:uncharacterized protein (TIGR02246 family)